MASGGPTGAAPAPNLCCSLCLEPFKGRNPKILPCFHSFCLSCLKTFEESLAGARSKEAGLQKQSDCDEKEKQDEEDSSGKEQGEEKGAEAVTFPCPTCRTVVVLPEGGVEKLQTNFYLETEDEGDSKTDPFPDPEATPDLCQMCEVGSERPATHACQQCEQRMCPECRRLHDKFTRGHQVSVLPATKARETTGVTGKDAGHGKCPLHKDQDICFLCRKCDTGICLHCKLTKHEGHETIDSATADAEAIAVIKSLTPKAQEHVSMLESYQRRLVRKGLEQARHADDATRRINARYDSALAAMKARRDQLLGEVTAWAEEASAKLLTKKTSTAAAKTTLSETLDKAKKAGTSRGDVVGARKALEEAMMDDDTQALVKQKIKASVPPPSWQYDQDASPDLGNHDPVVACMGSLVDVSDDGSGDVAAGLCSKQKKRSTPCDVGLSVWGSGKDIDVRDNVVILPNILANRGDGYDIFTGIFTAPVAGMYRITASLQMDMDCTRNIWPWHNRFQRKLKIVDETRKDWAFSCIDFSSFGRKGTSFDVQLNEGEKVLIEPEGRDEYVIENNYDNKIYKYCYTIKLSVGFTQGV